MRAGWARECYSVSLFGGEPRIVWARRRGDSVSATPVEPDDPTLRARLASGAALVVGGMSVRRSFTRWLEAPFGSIRKARRVLPSILDVELPFPLEACIYLFPTVARTAQGHVRALAVAARYADVQAAIRELDRCGLDPLFLDQEGVALWTQACREHAPAAGRARVVVHLCEDHIAVAIGHGAVFADAHAAPAADARQLSRLLRAAVPADGGEVEYVWAGPGAQDETYVAALHGELAAVRPGPSHVLAEPDLFLCRAFATRLLLDGPLRCNLRTDRLIHDGLRRRLFRRARNTALAYVACGLVLCGIGAAWRLLCARRDRHAKQAVVTQARALAPRATLQPGQELRAVRRAVAQQTERLRPFARAFAPSLSRTLVRIVAAGKTLELRYQALSLTDERVTIAGTAPDWDRCARLLPILQELGYTARVEREDALADERVRFSIAANAHGAH